ncbi:HD domain-containing protein [Streptomyces sp. NPDC014846]|uniref:HD domain-containing protein n=1 Tax=Streptomyces sp. NPDC014846 TaxID=3364922 RepID=UPI003702E57A
MRAHHDHADLVLIRQAYDEAARWHEGQTRRSGEPFITHCLAVAAILADLGMPPAVVCAALLHDIGDTPCPPDRVGERFGLEIAQLVTTAATAKVSTPLPSGRSSGAAADPLLDEAVVALCLADRLHNLRTAAFLPPATQRRKARQTLDVLVPLAHAAGMRGVGRELHDLSTVILLPASAGFGGTARFLAVLTLLIPASHRTRWREEWHGELATLCSRRARTCFVFRILLSTPRMSLALRRPARQERRW